jgi:C4-dicarboxylate transporter DctQ subunit
MKRFFAIINRVEETTLAITLLGLAFLAFYEAVQRYFFNQSFTWFEELVRYCSVFITFLGASLGVKYGNHFSMDFFVTRVGPKAAHVMRVITAWLSSFLFLLVSWYAWEHCQKLYKWGTASSAMQLPMYWAYAPIALFSLTLGVRFALDGFSHLRSLIKREPPPTSSDRKPDSEQDAAA